MDKNTQKLDKTLEAMGIKLENTENDVEYKLKATMDYMGVMNQKNNTAYSQV